MAAAVTGVPGRDRQPPGLAEPLRSAMDANLDAETAHRVAGGMSHDELRDIAYHQAELLFATDPRRAAALVEIAVRLLAADPDRELDSTCM